MLKCTPDIICSTVTMVMGKLHMHTAQKNCSKVHVTGGMFRVYPV